MGSQTLSDLQKQWFAQDTGAADPTASPASSISSLDWLNAGANVLGAALQPSSSGASSANSVFSTNLAFDNSGWNVSFGSGAINAAVDKTSSQGGASGLSGNSQTYLPYILLFVGSLIAWKMLKK